jgi:hypothetical protein
VNIGNPPDGTDYRTRTRAPRLTAGDILLARRSAMNLIRRSTLPTLLLLLTLPLAAADVTGKWNFEVSLDVGSGSPTFEFKQDGENLGGTYSGAAGEAKLTGTVKGTAIQFQFKTEWGTVKYEGTIEGPDSMKGKADYMGQANGTWTARRAK